VMMILPVLLLVGLYVLISFFASLLFAMSLTPYL
jgi:hypothetical protein